MPRGVYARLTQEESDRRDRFLTEQGALPSNAKHKASVAAKLNWSPAQPQTTPTADPTKLCDKAKLCMQIIKRLAELDLETVAFEKECGLKRESLELHRLQLTIEFNGLFAPVCRKNPQHMLALARHRTHRRWTGEEKQNFETTVKELLINVNGLTVGSISKQLKVQWKPARRLLDKMVESGDLRYVSVIVASGKNSKHKLRGYALPLQQVKSGYDRMVAGMEKGS